MSRGVLLSLFLGSACASALLPLHHLLRRRRPDSCKGWSFHEDRLDPMSRVGTRVRIRPVRGEGAVCQMCMGGIKPGLPYVKCGCGKMFHITCLKRTGFCPYCEARYTPDQVEGSSTYPNEEIVTCPMCGTRVGRETGKCQCGAIIADEEGKFYCPTCGTQIEDGENECPFCRERFEDVRLVVCPVCGRTFEEGAGTCSCGTFLGEVCPGCGVDLTAEDQACPACGLVFEVVG